MVQSEVCATEDALKVFLEYLVDPMLPAKSTSRDNPTLSQHQSVAKQVYSVVLLYNYYHRKQHTELAYLKFDEFCKLAVVLRPPLLAFMKYMQKPDETELVDADKQLSLTEKKIMDACDICTCLDASKNVPNIKGWPISKVAVLLIDSEKKNCVLLFSSITEGVWSVLEKDAVTPSQSSEVTDGTTGSQRKKRVIKKRTKDESNVDDTAFLQLGYSAVKEAAGINETDITVLESCTAYSHTKEKAASRFFIMKCSQLISQEVNQVPITDLIESLQGPLVKKSYSSWIFTPVVEYFHVLPYSKIISYWISREAFSNSIQYSKLAEKNVMADSPEVTESHKENNGSCTIIQSDSVEEAQDFAHTLQVSEDQEIETPSVQHYSNGSAQDIAHTLLILNKAGKDDSTRKIEQGEIKNKSACTQNCANTSSEKAAVAECSLTANHSNSELEKLQTLLASKKETLSQTALAALIRKRNELVLQQRTIEDEIALCDMKIHRISSGGEDELEIKIESIIEGCNDIWVRNRGRMSRHSEKQCSPPCFKRKRLSEAVLTMQSPCQELDAICHENNWILPTYHISHSDGEFQANVTVKGPDFECSCGDNTFSNPLEAREAAAAQILAKLRNMTKPDH